MKLVVFGASGTIGSRIVAEALNRGHQITAVSQDPDSFDRADARINVVRGNVLDPASVAQVVRGADAVVSSIGVRRGKYPQSLMAEGARALIAGLRQAGVRRLVVVSSAGSLEVAPGQMLMDTPGFNPQTRPGSLSHLEALKALREASDLEWTAISPPQTIRPGERTGNFRVGAERLLTDAEGKSAISTEDYAVALVDELEQPRHVRQRFTVAY